MDSGKRASMREGPLASLFSRTDDESGEEQDALEENFGDRMFVTRIRKTVRFAEAPVKGMSVLKYDPKGVAADAYRQLAKEVLSNVKR